MAEKRKRGQNFIAEEKDKLVKLLLEHKNTILNKKTDGSTNEAKAQAWTELTASFNATGFNYRSKESLTKVWEKMKTESKLYYSTSRRNITQTGGGPSIIKCDSILEQVCNIMGRGCTGIEGVNDSDSISFTEDKSLPKVICLDNTTSQDNIIKTGHNNNSEAEICVEVENTVIEEPIINTPLWSRRRPASSHNNERSKAVGLLCSTFKNINKKKEDVEDIKHALLIEELEFKRNLSQLLLQTASKDVIIKDLEIEIKKAVLKKIQGGG